MKTLLRIIVILMIFFIISCPQKSSTDPDQQEPGLHEIGYYELPYGTDVNDVFVIDDHAYLASYGIRVVDVSDPATPTYISSNGTQENEGQSVFVKGGYAYLADLVFGLIIYDASDLDYPVAIDTFSSSATDVFFKDNYTYVTKGFNGIQIWDFSDMNNPDFISNFDTPDNAVGIAVSDGYAYVADESTLEIIDVNDPANPTIVYSLPAWSALGIDVSDNKVYLARADGLSILDVTDPTNPTGLGSYTMYGYATDVYVHDNIAYLIISGTADGDQLLVIDVTDPINPLLLDNYISNHGYVETVFADDNYIYIGERKTNDNWRGGLIILEYVR